VDDLTVTHCNWRTEYELTEHEFSPESCSECRLIATNCGGVDEAKQEIRVFNEEQKMLTENWSKATKSNPSGNCVECRFVTATKSGAAGHCVEVSRNGLHNNLVLVRDSKDNGNGLTLSFTQEQWNVFLKEVNTEGMNWAKNAGGMYVVTSPDVMSDDELFFTEDEWDAFIDGVRQGEFDIEAA
jgi:hypothetical protein